MAQETVACSVLSGCLDSWEGHMGKSLPNKLAEVASALGMFAEGPGRTQQGDQGWAAGVSARPSGKSERGFEAMLD